MKDEPEIVLTIDIDWAPDFAVDWMTRMLSDRGVKATWFVTHMTQSVGNLRNWPDLFELGVHPNFLPGSTHGADTESVLDHVLELVPDAISTRSHSVVSSGRLLEQIAETDRLRVESTIFLPEMDCVRPIVHRLRGRDLLKIPFVWSDDYEMNRERPDWSLHRHLERSGLSVLAFHPIHTYLNTCNVERYQSITEAYPRIDELTLSAAETWVTNGSGPRSMFLEVLDVLRNSDSVTLREIHQRHVADR